MVDIVLNVGYLGQNVTKKLETSCCVGMCCIFQGFTLFTLGRLPVAEMTVEGHS